MPIWMQIDAAGIPIVDVRDERAAVHMAHAHAEVTGELGVALITAGPGVTNAMTGIANAHVARAPVLILSGLPPTFQENRGASGYRPCRLCPSDYALRAYGAEPSLVLQELDEAVSRAFGQGGDRGRCISIFQPILCVVTFPGRCSWKSISGPSGRRRFGPIRKPRQRPSICFGPRASRS